MSPARDGRRVAGIDRGIAFELLLDGQPVAAYPGETIAAALLASGHRALRRTAGRGEPRGVYCAMGVCGECAMVVNGQTGVRTCVTPATAGMTIARHDGRDPAPPRTARSPDVLADADRRAHEGRP